jgi:hypothetical protein
MPITAFTLSFKPQTNQFRIDVQLQNGQQQQLAINSIEEFIAVAALLNRGNAIVLPDGTIQSRG